MVVLCGIEVVWEKPMEESRDFPVGMRVGCVKQSPGLSISGRWSSVLRESQVETYFLLQRLLGSHAAALAQHSVGQGNYNSHPNSSLKVFMS